MKLNEIKLGRVVRDVVTGYTGYAVTKVDVMGGNVQLCVQPAGKVSDEGQVFPDAVNMDYHTLEFVDGPVQIEVTKPIKITVELGDEVEDTVTGLTGVATTRHTYINGCIYYMVQPKAETDKQSGLTGVPDAHHFNQVRLRVTKPAAVPVATVARAPGGPATKAMRPT